MAINFLNNISLNKNQLEQARIENLAADPGSGVSGQIYFNTVSNVLKIYDGTIWKEVGGGVITIDTANSTFINLVDSGTAEDPILTASLSATGTPSSSTFLRGDNTWAATPNQYTGWSLAGNTGTTQTINSGDTASILGGTAISTVASATDTITINHASITRTDTTSTALPAFGATFTAVDSVTSNAQGHITALNLKTVTLPTPTPDTNTTYTLPVAAGGANTAVINLTAGGSGSGVASSVTFSGTTNEIEVTETVGNNGTIVIGLPNNVTVTGALTVSGAAQSSFGGQVTIPLTPIANTDAASKNYVDASNVGQSVFQGGYNAATNTPDLDVAPSALIKKGWFWAVTNTGVFFSETVQPGDLLYANVDNPGATFANWVVVQSGQDIAGEGATDGATVKGVAGFNSAHFNVSANGWVSSDIYAGGSNLGIVPSGGAGTTFLRGDGTWVVPSGTYVLPVATSTTLGGVELFSDTVQTVAANPVSATAGRSYGVQLNSAGQAVVNVPWIDTNSITSVSASAVNNRLGLAITPTTGAVVAGLSIDTLADITTTTDAADSLPIYDTSATTNKRVTVTNLASATNALTTATGTIAAGSLSGTVTHALGINTIVQTIDSTGATVFCDVTRTSTTVVATVSAVQANPITILVQKIG
jgi:hypothetical protein